VSPKRYAQVAGVLFAAQAVFAVIHLALGANYTPHFTHPFSVATDVVLAVASAAAAVASLTPLTWPAAFVMICGASVSAMQFFIYTLATNPAFGPKGVGVPFLAAAGVQFFCIVRAAPPLTPVVAARAPSRPPRRVAWVPRLRHTH
jgi:hypothetical protein